MEKNRICHRKGFYGFLICAFLLTSAQAKAQWLNGSIIQFEFDGNGAKAIAMGGAFVALANDVSALAWNPAGMAQLKVPELNITGRANFSSYNINPPENLSDSLRYKTSVTSQILLNFVGAIFPFQINTRSFMGGIAVRSLAEPMVSTKWREENIFSQREHIIKREINSGLYALSPSMSVQLYNFLYVGSTLNFITGRYEENTSEVRIVGEAKKESWNSWDSKLSGFSAELGLLFKPHRKIRLGATVTSPFTINITDIDSANSDGFKLKSQESIYYRLPIRAAVGCSFRLTRRITIAGDWRLNPWSKIKFELGDSLILPTRFSDGNSIHVGLEYLFQSGDVILPLRFGYFRQQQHYCILKQEKSNTIGEPVIKQAWASGFCIQTRPVSFDVALTFDMMRFNQDVQTIFNQTLPMTIFKVVQINYRLTISAVYYL